MRKCGKALLILLNSAAALMYFVLDWTKWDCTAWADGKYNSLISGWIFILFVAAQFAVLIFAGVINIIKLRTKAAALAVAFLCFLPFVKSTNIYFDIDYSISREMRENIVSMILSNRDDVFYQTDLHNYVLPKEYRRASLTSQIFVEKEGAITVLFDVQKGLFGGKGIIYASDYKPYKNALGVKFNKVKEIKKGWYRVDWDY